MQMKQVDPNHSQTIDFAVVWQGKWHGQPRIYIKAPYRYKDRLKALPGAYYDGAEKAWHVAWSPSLWPAVSAALSGLHIRTDEATACLESEHTRVSEALAQGEQMGWPDTPTKTTAWEHQRRIFALTKDMSGVGLFIDMGGGKSLVAIAQAEYSDSDLVIILCPKSVMGVWPKQFSIHGLSRWSTYVADGNMTVAKKANKIMEFMLRPVPKGTKRAVIINYDAAWRPGMGEMLLKMAKEAKQPLLIMDESHKIKSPSGKASKFCASLGKVCTVRRLLTGTPMPHGPEDIYGQYRAADPGVYGTSYNRFKNRYFHLRPIKEHVSIIEARMDPVRGVKSVIKPDVYDEFHQKLGSISFVVKREEMGLDVPARLPSIDRYVDLTNKSLKHYVALERDFITELSNGAYVVADNALTKLMRLRQICSGYLKDEDGTEHDIGTEKQELFADVLDDLPRDEPIVVFAAFHHDLDAIRNVASAAGRTYGELSGRRRDGLASDSTLAPGLDVVGVQLQSGGVGVDFTRSRYGVYYSIDFNLGNIEQSFARLDRPGQQHRVAFIHLLTRFPTGGMTVDGVTYKAIEERRDLVEATLEASRR
jgi:hypothetical protein